MRAVVAAVVSGGWSRHPPPRGRFGRGGGWGREGQGADFPRIGRGVAGRALEDQRSAQLDRQEGAERLRVDLGMAHQQPPALDKRAEEAGHALVDRLPAEVDEDIPAQDEVERRQVVQQRGIGMFDQVVVLERGALAVHVSQPVTERRGIEAGVPQVGIHAPQCPIAEAGLAGPGQELPVDVGPDHTHVPPGELAGELALEHHGQRVGLGAEGAAGAPDADLPAGGVAPDERGDDRPPQRLEVLLEAEEMGLTDREIADQLVELGLPGRAIAQQVQIGRAAGQLKRGQPLGDLFAQLVVLVGVEGQPGPLQQILLEAAVAEVARQSRGLHRRQAHGVASSSWRRRRCSIPASATMRPRSSRSSSFSTDSRWTVWLAICTACSAQSLNV
jgi:hypothetical protein